MSIFIKILGIIVIDFVLIWLWVYQMNPDPSTSIVIILLFPLVIIVNLIIAWIFYFKKKRVFGRIFLINSIIAPLITFYLFGRGIARNVDSYSESWEFEKSDTLFTLIRWKHENAFSITYSLNPGSSSGYLDGECINDNNEWVLVSGDVKMKIIEDNRLIGFGKSNDTINLRKIEL